MRNRWNLRIWKMLKIVLNIVIRALHATFKVWFILIHTMEHTLTSATLFFGFFCHDTVQLLKYTRITVYREEL